MHVELHPDVQHIYDHYHTMFEHALYTTADDTDKKQRPPEDEEGMIINAGVWRKLDLLSVDPNNEAALRLKEQYGGRGTERCESRPEEEPMEPYDEGYERPGDGSRGPQSRPQRRRHRRRKTSTWCM